jgi:hypothetical protein
LSLAHLLRIVGPAVMALGVGWVAIAIGPGLTSPWSAAFAAVTAASTAAALALIWRPPRVLTLTDSGYRVGRLLGGGRQPTATWREVDAVQAADVDGTRALVFTHVDGRRRAIAMSLLGNRGSEAQREINFRLNRAFGYRRL